MRRHVVGGDESGAIRRFVVTGTVSDLRSPRVIERKGKRLIGKTFRDILNHAIETGAATYDHVSFRDYGGRGYKGGLGTLIEELVYGYSANSDSRPDFVEAGVELKTTCFDVKKNGDYSAGERLVLTMIPYDREVSDDLRSSHLWAKMRLIMLIVYRRDAGVDRYDQEICYAQLFSPSDADLKIIEDDFKKITNLVRAGRAEELSESMTAYLGACTKGTGKQKLVAQFYPPHTGAKKRAFCFKRSYMDYVLHRYLMNEDGNDEAIVADAALLGHQTFEEYVASVIHGYVGMTDRELCEHFHIPYSGSKAQWTELSYRMLGVRGDKAEEFSKANISVRTVREQPGGANIREALSLNTFKFKELLAEECWEDSALRAYMEETRFFFVVFEKGRGGNGGGGEAPSILKGCMFWSMPVHVIDGELRACWEETRRVLAEGVEIIPCRNRSNGIRYANNLPGSSDNAVAHVRPHATRSYYRFEDGTEVGESERYGNELPDGRWMTTQSFWLNAGYIRSILAEAGL